MEALLGLLIVLCTIYSGEALSCYSCNSRNLSACAADTPPETTKVECATREEYPDDTTCLKIVQHIDFKIDDMEEEKRVIRACSLHANWYELRCNHDSGFGGKREVCSCNTDFCNSSKSHFVGFCTFIIVLLARFVL